MRTYNDEVYFILFGKFYYFCVRHALQHSAFYARKEMNVAFTELLRRTTNWRLTPGRNNRLHWPNLILRGLQQLHIGFDKRA